VASIKKTPLGRWKVRYWMPDGLAQRSKTFDRKVDAERFAAHVEHEKTRGEWIDPQRGQVTLAEWTGEWWPTVVSLSPSPSTRLRGIIDNHVLPRFGPVQLAEITQPSVAVWVVHLTELGLSPASVQKCIRRSGGS